jgi:hypothetical protein
MLACVSQCAAASVTIDGLEHGLAHTPQPRNTGALQGSYSPHRTCMSEKMPMRHTCAATGPMNHPPQHTHSVAQPQQQPCCRGSRQQGLQRCCLGQQPCCRGRLQVLRPGRNSSAAWGSTNRLWGGRHGLRRLGCPRACWFGFQGRLGLVGSGDCRSWGSCRTDTGKKKQDMACAIRQQQHAMQGLQHPGSLHSGDAVLAAGTRWPCPDLQPP